MEENPFPMDFVPGEVDATTVNLEDIDHVSVHLINAANLLVVMTKEDLKRINPDQIFSSQYRENFKSAMSEGDLDKAMKIVQLQMIYMELQHAYLESRKQKIMKQKKIKEKLTKNKASIRSRVKTLLSLPKEFIYSEV